MSYMYSPLYYVNTHTHMHTTYYTYTQFYLICCSQPHKEANWIAFIIHLSNEAVWDV